MNECVCQSPHLSAGRIAIRFCLDIHGAQILRLWLFPFL